MTDSLPRSRHDDLLIQDVLDEVLIYDTLSQEVHCLNAAAAAIWRACDGQTTLAALAAAAGTATGAPWDENIVRLALDQLQERDLLDAAPSAPWMLLSRRDLMARIAVPMLLLPLVTSLSVPTPAMAQSCGPQGPQCGPQGF